MKLKFILGLALVQSLAFGHFGVILPSESSVENDKQSNLNLTYKFTHPFEGEIMNMVKPNEAIVAINGKKTSILSTLKEEKSKNLSFWSAKYQIKEPAMYQFAVDPKPYFEPSENKFIRHITKTIVNAYGYGEGWDEPLGLKAEIIPLSRPFGLYKNNIFTGKVLYKNKPAKGVIVEIEYYNEKGLKAPSEDHITQEVKTNDQGEFSFAMPLAGWWGFAALIDDDQSINHENKKYPVELGAVIWVQTKDYK